MGLTSFLNVNGYDFPCPAYGFQYTISTTVNAGRNVSGAVVGQRGGRDIYKLSTLQWVGLEPEVRRMILNALEPFYVQVTFEDFRTGKPITITMSPGDRTGKPLFVDKQYATCEQDFSSIDGSMYFLPKKSSGMDYYNNGIVTQEFMGTIYITFKTIYCLDIKGLKIKWGEHYPIDFTIENNEGIHTYDGNMHMEKKIVCQKQSKSSTNLQRNITTVGFLAKRNYHHNQKATCFLKISHWNYTWLL